MTVLAIVMDMILVLLGIGMRFGAKFGITRQMSLVPVLVAALDAAFLGKIDPMLTPLLSALLIALQAVVLLGGATLLYQDRVRVRNKQLRRQRRREVAYTRQAFERAAEARTARSGRVCA